MRCKVGDLAVANQTHNRGNLGTVVRVIATHDGTGDIRYPSAAGQVWLVEGPRPMKWTFQGKTYKRKTGPVPDRQLQPIRGKPTDVNISAAVKKLMSRLKCESATSEA